MSHTPLVKTRKDSTTVIMPTMTPKDKGGGSASTMLGTPPSGPIVKIKNTKDMPITSKTPKRQKSSRFHVAERIEMEKLPNLKGIVERDEGEREYILYLFYTYFNSYTLGLPSHQA
jgi:hypothetical protein